jgi:hypothetical protein
VIPSLIGGETAVKLRQLVGTECWGVREYLGESDRSKDWHCGMIGD